MAWGRVLGIRILCLSLSLPPVPKVPSEDIIEGPPGTITVLSIKSQQSVAVSKS